MLRSIVQIWHVVSPVMHKLQSARRRPSKGQRNGCQISRENPSKGIRSGSSSTMELQSDAMRGGWTMKKRLSLLDNDPQEVVQAVRRRRLFGFAEAVQCLVWLPW